MIHYNALKQIAVQKNHIQAILAKYHHGTALIKQVPPAGSDILSLGIPRQSRAMPIPGLHSGERAEKNSGHLRGNPLLSEDIDGISMPLKHASS